MEFNYCFNPFTLLSSWVWRSHKNTNLPSGFSLNTAKMEGLVVSSSSVSSENGCGDSCSLSSESLSSSIDEKNLTLGWPIRKGSVKNLVMGDEKKIVEDEQLNDKPKTSVSEIELMKERFSKLLLGEDMSGCGKGVCTALAISNAITNLCATLFGELWRLEPLSIEKKAMWKREMEWLLCVSDHIVEFLPSCQIFPDGSKLEVMTCRPRLDLFINLPALRKLDTMLLETLDSFHDQEFWYIDQGIFAQDSEDSASFRSRPFQRQEEKWWLPVPRVPPGGLQEVTRKNLHHKRECTNQILKAAMAINDGALLEMEVPQSYFESLPKNARECLGDVIYRYITSDQFSPACLLDCLEFSSEHQALEIANRVEASTYIWRRKNTVRNKNNADRIDVLADRAESIMLCLKQRFPGLTQTSLDMSKIQFNKDVGKSILESYSRVLESVAFNIIARIDDLLYVDDLAKHSDQASSTMLCRKVALPYATTSCSPVPLIGSAVKTERTPFALRKPSNRGFGVKKALTDYLNGEVRGRHNSIFEK